MATKLKGETKTSNNIDNLDEDDDLYDDSFDDDNDSIIRNPLLLQLLMQQQQNDISGIHNRVFNSLNNKLFGSVSCVELQGMFIAFIVCVILYI